VGDVLSHWRGYGGVICAEWGSVAAASDELNGACDDLGGITLLALGVFPLASLDATVDEDCPALA